MANKKAKKPKRTPSHEIVSDEEARKALKVEEPSIVNSRVNELANLLWRHEGMSEDEINTRITRAIEHFNSLKPSDGAEGMLAQQMVGTHLAAIQCGSAPRRIC